MSRFPFTSHPDGWFVAAYSEDLPVGEVVTRHYFDQDIVIFRTEDGVAHAIEPYCPHLGAHLGYGGKLEGNTLRCPFHGWCFNDEGACVSIPRVDKPLNVKLTQWRLLEANGMIYLHHHGQGLEPTWEPPVVDMEGWTPNQTYVCKLRTHAQEIFENIVDLTHLEILHQVGNPRLTKEIEEDGPIMRLRQAYVSPVTQVDVEFDVTVYGLGVTVVRGNMMGTEFRYYILPTPIDDEHIDLRLVANIKIQEDPEQAIKAAQGYLQGVAKFLAEDHPIWENKIYLERPLLTKEEYRPIMQFRKWAQQFYTKK